MERNKIISLMGNKGGISRTTSAINIGAWFSLCGKCKILVIDGDGQANLTGSLAIDESKIKGTIYDLITNDDVKAEDIIYRDSALLFDVIVADSRLNDIDMAIMNAYDRERLLSYKLESIKKYYDYIIIDSPPIINQATINILVASDYLLIPVQSNYLGVRGISTLTDTIEKIKKRMNPNIKILGYFLAMYDSRTNTDKGIYELIQEQFGELAFKTYIRQNSKLKEAPMEQKTIFEYDRNSNGAIDYYNLCIEIWKKLGGSVNDGK